MAEQLWLVRHGETEWSRTGRHTSTTDVALTATGAEQARAVAPRLAEESFSLVLTSPLRRARRTAELAGFPDAVVDDDLVEWRYGEYEGVTTPEIRRSVPDWTVWTRPTPGGETPVEVGTRLDRVVARVRDQEGRVLAFGHGHALRVLAARWLGLPAADGRLLVLDTATVSVLGSEHGGPAVLRWNAG
ncbi:MAG: histidine phosphatase family protein [Marmoricola sp.]